jgi:hypothetical protein
MPYPIVSTPNKKGFFGKLKDMTTGNTEAEKKIWKDSEAGRRLQAQVGDPLSICLGVIIHTMNR